MKKQAFSHSTFLLLHIVLGTWANEFGSFSKAKNYELQGEQITASLEPMIKIQAKVSEKFDSEVIYSHLKIFSGSTLVVDDSMVEIELGELSPVKYRILKNGACEILIELNDRPDINKSKRFIIQGAEVQRDDTIPLLSESEAHKGIFTGVMSSSEAVCLNCDSVVYNPVLAYKATNLGLSLDSNETRKINVEEYGKFHGFKYREDIIVVKRHKKT